MAVFLAFFLADGGRYTCSTAYLGKVFALADVEACLAEAGGRDGKAESFLSL